MLQFFVVNHGTDWVVKRKTQSVDRYTDRLKAITAAIDLANAEGKQDPQLAKRVAPSLRQNSPRVGAGTPWDEAVPQTANSRSEKLTFG